jgi:hypothetical protein
MQFGAVTREARHRFLARQRKAASHGIPFAAALQILNKNIERSTSNVQRPIF